MSLFRPVFRFVRPMPTLRSSVQSPRFLTTTISRSAAQGYGDGKGDPNAETPQQQGSSNKAKEHAEHPGPAPVSEGKGSGSGPTKGSDHQGGKSPEEASANSGGSRSKEAKETGSSPTGGKIGGKGEKSSGDKVSEDGGAKPKISKAVKPDVEKGSLSGKESAEVEQHNKEFRAGHDHAQHEDHAAEKEGDGVSKKFWKGKSHFYHMFCGCWDMCFLNDTRQRERCALTFIAGHGGADREA